MGNFRAETLLFLVIYTILARMMYRLIKPRYVIFIMLFISVLWTLSYYIILSNICTAASLCEISCLSIIEGIIFGYISLYLGRLF
jgi:hypothetical protein